MSVNNPQYEQYDGETPAHITTQKKRGEKILNAALIIAVAVLIIAVVLRAFVIANVQIRQTSMFPTYKEDERVWVDKTGRPERGEVVVFFKEDVGNKFFASFFDNDKKLIKRAIALQGDKIWAVEENGNYSLRIMAADTGEITSETDYVKNGVKVEIPLTAGSKLGRLKDTTESLPYVVPEGCFFAVGDNRNVSEDSRGVLGAVPYDRLFGVVY